MELDSELELEVELEMEQKRRGVNLGNFGKRRREDENGLSEGR